MDFVSKKDTHRNNIMKLLFTATLVFTFSIVTAQSLEGEVNDEEDQPLMDVTIYNRNSGMHAHSDTFGNFILENTAAKDTLFFSSLGYETLQYVVPQEPQNSKISVVLKTKSFSLDQVVVVSKVSSLNQFVDVDVNKNPVTSSQQILQRVPGLFIGQHAGGGKAEQLFLRGFDIDHGTDVAISVDGLPVNMVSHAHGQGYADLHFVIPETINNIDFGLGPFYANKGNFNTAGYVDLNLKKRIEKSMISVETGDFNTTRFVGLFNLLKSKRSNAYFASELFLSDGPFESPQNFNRFNVMGRYNHVFENHQEITITTSHFQSRWDASGQIPQRAVDAGLISRFGAIDDTEGGETSRTNLAIDYLKQLGNDASIKTQAYLSTYDFKLYSNFTFFLEDPVNGDQIRQQEDRMLAGLSSTFEKKRISLSDAVEMEYSAGLGFRFDKVRDVELSKTLNRNSIVNRLAFGDIDEVNTFGFFDSRFKTGKWLFNPSIRVDYFRFNYANNLVAPFDSSGESKVAISPKFNMVYTNNSNLQLFMKTGIGFHSNDSRVVVANTTENTLPAAYGLDIGTIVKASPNLVLNATAWGLLLEQEFVYVGDAGIVEPSGKTRRLGVDFGMRYEATDWLYLNADLNYTYARSVEEMDGEDFIPLAPDLTSSGGIFVDNLGGFSGGVNYRFIKDRPANEDNSIIAEGYLVNDLNASYQWKNWTFGVIIENLFDTEWNETQFATESRLFDENQPSEEIHFTPGTPFFTRAKVVFQF